jgi:lipopolysaccharide cholinephosphotransferase
MEDIYTDPKKIEKLHKIMFNMHNIFMKFAIQYWVTSGTLLGVVRHKGIIPWDNDLDVEMNNNYKKFLDSSEFKKEIKKYDYSLFKHQGGWYKIRDNKNKMNAFDIFFTKEKIRNDRNTIGLYGKPEKNWPNQYFYPDELFPLKLYKLSNFYVLGPNKPNNHLKRMYGNDWNKVGYITQDPDSHSDLDKPIKIKVTKFVPGRNFYDYKTEQILPNKSSILLTKEFYKDGYKLLE